MKMFLALLCLARVVVAAAQSAYDFGSDASIFTRSQDGGGANATHHLVGRLPLAPNGSVPLRPEVRQLESDPYKWDLFMLALSMFQNASQDDAMSWYGVAGIHGVPFQPWNGVGPAKGAAESGYCMHSSVLFPMWHRPFVAIVEQETYRLVNLIAGLFTNSTERRAYQRAASTFRWPYWDWAMPVPENHSQFPSVFWSPTIDQYGPNGVQTISNPLHSYHFDPLNETAMIWAPLKYWSETKRGPNLNVSITDPPSRNGLVNDAMEWILPDIQQRLFNIFSKYHRWNKFSNQAYAMEHHNSHLDSLEAIHDTIHIYSGLKGQMAYIPLSAFDPIFFLHHAMVDRLLTMWQVIYPSSWVEPMPNEQTSYNAPKGTVQTSDSPLTPFMVSQDGTFWDANMARSPETFGYQYADTYSPSMSPQRARDNLMRKIATWYGHTSTWSLTKRSGTLTARGRDATTLAAEPEAGVPNVRPDAPDPPAAAVITDDAWTEWIANAHADAASVNQSFSLHFFVGQPPHASAGYLWAKNRIGSVDFMSAFTSPDSRAIVSGAVPMTRALTKLVARGDISNLSPTAVKAFLEKNLQFRVQGATDGEEISPQSIGELGIEVVSADARALAGVHLPEWGPEVPSFTVWPAS